MKLRNLIATVIAIPLLGFGLAACDDGPTSAQQYKEVQRTAAKRAAYLPKNGVELNNYNRAQQLYDTPDTIIWCSTTWGNASAPIVTIPVAGKLTSSTVSYFPSTQQDPTNDHSYSTELRSVDGMYHGTPPPYRYGFTPGGQYVDFFNMPTFCTTALTSYQRQNTKVQVVIDADAKAAQARAEAFLKAGNPQAAQDALVGLAGQ